MRFFCKLLTILTLSFLSSCTSNNEQNYWAEKGLEIAKTTIYSKYVADNYYFTYCAYNFVENGYDIPNTYYCELTFSHSFEKNIIEVGTFYYKYTQSSFEVEEIPDYLVTWTRNSILDKSIYGYIGFINL